jgi:hypothetical protein
MKPKHIKGAIVAVIVVVLCVVGLILIAPWGGEVSQPPHALNQD